MSHEISVRSANTVEQRAAALELLFSRSDPAERAEQVAEAVAAHETQQFDLSGLLIAYHVSDAAGAALTVSQEDGTTYVWPPVAEANSVQGAVVDALFDAIHERVPQAGSWLGQCLLEPHQTADSEALERNDFSHMAELQFLSRSLADPLPDRPVEMFQKIEFNEQDNQFRFAKLLEATYQGSLDCPNFSGLRTGEEALASHRTAGEFSPNLWNLYEVDGQDAGVLLFARHSEENTWEVAYTGIHPAARGRGLGKAILLDGMHEALQAGVGNILLAVDSNNKYALKVYRELGFLGVGQRSVFIKVYR